MKIAHLILAHKNPQQLERLINALKHPSSHFYIHIDKKTEADTFQYLSQKENIFFIKNRTKIYWAGYGTIQATLNGLKEILPLNYDYINVTSAQDFPIKPPQAFYEHLIQKQGTEFITCESIEDEWTEAAPRMRKYHLINWQIPGKYRLENLLNKIIKHRKFPLNHKIVGRANWFTISHYAAQYILYFLKKNPKVIRYYKYVWGADEFIFSTILYNSFFRERIENNLVYVDWSEKKAHPKILTSDDFEKLKGSDKFLARKFDTDVDEKILSMLEKWLNTKASALT